MNEKDKPEVGPLSGKEPTAWQGPLRKAPTYYAGDGFIKGRPVNHADVQRYASGRVLGIRNKAARRVLRGKLARSRSSVEKGIRFAQQLRQQAYALSDNGHEARRMLAKELALHVPAPQPRVRGQRKRVPRHVREKIEGTFHTAASKAFDKKEDK